MTALVLEYRAPARTIECVNALLRDGVASVLVIDNSADAGTSYSKLESVFSGDSRVRLYKATANLGFAAGMNLGLSMVTSKRILLINNDAIVEPGLVSALSQALSDSPEVSVAYPSLVHAGKVMEELYYHRWFATVSSCDGVGKFKVPRGCCMMLASERLSRGPLFDEAFFMYGEDIELGWRMQQRKERMAYVPRGRVVHEGSASSGLGSTFYELHTARAHLLLATRLSKSPFQASLLWLVRLPFLGVRACIRAWRFKSLTPLRALTSAFRSKQ